MASCWEVKCPAAGNPKACGEIENCPIFSKPKDKE